MIDTAHSRFPVYEGERDNIIGLLLAKDLLVKIIQPEVDVRSNSSDRTFCLKLSALNQLLKEFKKKHAITLRW